MSGKELYYQYPCISGYQYCNSSFKKVLRAIRRIKRVFKNNDVKID